MLWIANFTHDNGATYEDKVAIIQAETQQEAKSILDDTVCRHSDDCLLKVCITKVSLSATPKVLLITRK